MVWDEGMGGGVEDVEKVGCGYRWVQVQGNDCYRWKGSSWKLFGRSYWIIYYVGTVYGQFYSWCNTSRTRFLEGSHFVKGRFGEFGTCLAKPLINNIYLLED